MTPSKTPSLPGVWLLHMQILHSDSLIFKTFLNLIFLQEHPHKLIYLGEKGTMKLLLLNPSAHLCGIFPCLTKKQLCSC